MARPNISDSSSPEYTKFTEALRKVLRVSHAEMKEGLVAAKKAKASKPRPSSRVSGERG
jgi:hypothetical protein